MVDKMEWHSFEESANSWVDLKAMKKESGSVVKLDVRAVEQKVFASEPSSVVQRVLGEVGRMDGQ